MNYTIGIDIGITSIGITVVKTQGKDDKKGIIIIEENHLLKGD